MNYQIKFPSDGRYIVSDDTSLHEMKNRCPLFFRTPHGSRETFSVYRGQLIVRNTVKFTGEPPTRRTIVYLFLLQSLTDTDHRMPDLFCVGHPTNIRGAHNLIDGILDKGEYKGLTF